jgi:hypothetical protein
MNSMKWLALVVAILVAVNCQRGKASNKSRKQGAKAAVSRVATPLMDDVEGNGESAEKARKQAKENAIKRVEELLQQRFGRSGWLPAAEDLDPATLEELKVIQLAGEPLEGPGVVGPVNFKATYHVELNAGYLQKLVAKVRQQKVEERHLLLARVLVGILALVLVTAGYLRLEEMTRGYATKLLRLAAVVLLALVGAGLFLTK